MCGSARAVWRVCRVVSRFGNLKNPFDPVNKIRWQLLSYPVPRNAIRSRYEPRENRVRRKCCLFFLRVRSGTERKHRISAVQVARIYSVDHFRRPRRFGNVRDDPPVFTKPHVRSKNTFEIFRYRTRFLLLYF